ncbi:MAG TPA: hypothetical protein DDZ76_06900 [Xanthomonadales bacterium]|nr:hypothetical protein [Xanthomonadales bacterium]
MLHPNLDPLKWRDALARQRRLQIRPILQPRAAEALHLCLSRDVPWTLAFRRNDHSSTLDREHYADLDDPARDRLLREIAAEARGRYAFAYESYMMIRNYNEGRDPDLLLHRILEYLNSEEFLYFARSLTGFSEIRRISAQATRYRPGHFLRIHNDVDADEGRLAAYVINLTRRWSPDWGGLLHFMDTTGEVVDSFTPHFNSLSVFLVPSDHAVSLVAPFAEQDRLAITGWFQT